MNKKKWTMIQIIIVAILIPGILLIFWVTGGKVDHILVSNPIYRWSTVLIIISGFYVAVLAQISISTGKTDKKTHLQSFITVISILILGAIARS
ncbi:hypothetical protein ACM26V_18740 [Salipaludibacillus sp. HK11]|uniref:hypothetical protein n=1 Tax=Salipaludibacillus sp. HK11 TaxID=3394320 RepID=UPI0039FD2DCD